MQLRSIVDMARRFLSRWFRSTDSPDIVRVVDNRVFLLGLDYFYRSAIKRHEATELLTCSRAVARTLGVGPADVPIEGYYYESDELTEYFLLMRTLQAEDMSRTAEVAAMPEFQRVLEVSFAPLFGRPQHNGRLLPTGRDPLSEALLVEGWTIDVLISAAQTNAMASGDVSLVGLAARSGDAVVVAALRESVVLYAEKALMGREPQYRYVWKVDADIEYHAARFIAAFEKMFGDKMPAPMLESAEQYWLAYDDNRINGRCVCLGTNPSGDWYHWAITSNSGGELVVEEFWDRRLWTTEMYRAARAKYPFAPIDKLVHA